jgi:hypothetical protein
MTNFFFKIKKKKKEEEIQVPDFYEPQNSIKTIISQEKEVRTTIYPKIIYDLKTVSQWPSETTIRCWNCTRNFTGIPIGLPYLYKGGVYYVKGIFCGFKCANSYNRTNSMNRKWIQESLLNQMYFEFGNRSFPIGTAPLKEIMIMYGGPYTEQEYGELLKNDYVINTIYPPLISLNSTISISLPTPQIVSDTTSHSIQDLELGPSRDAEKKYRFSRKTRLIQNK